MGIKRKIIFLNRKNPASIGGVQRHMARLCAGLSNSFDIEKIDWNGPEWGAPVYFPLFYYKSMSNGAELLHCDDAVTAMIGARVRNKTDKKVVAAVHGLDVILPLPWYQKRISKALPQLDRIVCVSRATARQARLRGVSDDKIEIIPCAAEKIENRLSKSEQLYGKFEHLTGINLSGKRLLFSLGRPVRRKGFDAFITDVFPHLPEDFVYIVAGPVPKTPTWIKNLKPLLGEKHFRLFMLASGCDSVHERLIELSSNPRVHYLYRVSDDLREILFALSDLFIMPNRTVEGDMEGFGLVALEASIRGIPVIAAGIEGIPDAVIDGQNGFCLKEGDVAAMVRIIRSLSDDLERKRDFGEKARKFTEQRFSPSTVYARYAELFEKVLDNSQRAPAGSNIR